MLHSSSYISVVSLIMVCLLIDNTSEVYAKSDYNTKEGFDEARLKLDKILATVANVNEQKLNALKKFTALDNYNLASGLLGNDEGQKDSLIANILLNLQDPSEILKVTPNENFIQLEKENYNDDIERSEEMKEELFENDAEDYARRKDITLFAVL